MKPSKDAQELKDEAKKLKKKKEREKMLVEFEKEKQVSADLKK